MSSDVGGPLAEMDAPSAGIQTEHKVVTWDDGSSYEGDVLPNGSFHGTGMMIWNTGPDEGNRYKGEWDHDVIHGKGVYTWKDGREYDGEYVKGVFQGNGVHTWPEGSRYEGGWHAGKSHGKGFKFWGKGQLKGGSYDGEWSMGAVHGEGVFKWADGNEYAGGWFQGKRMGEGTMLFQGLIGVGGGKYQGSWIDDQMNGTGKYWWPNGNHYIGDWKEGARNGTGTLVFGSDTQNAGDKYNGAWTSNKTDGFGVYEFKDGGRYEGNWRDGKRHGQGTRIWPNGHRYSGMWVDDVINGSGTYIWEEGTVYDGDWKAGLCHGQGRKMWTSGVSAGNIYTGGWIMGKMEGEGEYMWQDGSTYRGAWSSGRCTGHGVMNWSTGDTYDGEWLKDAMHGIGQYVDKRSGNIYKGAYESGKRHGMATHLYAKYGQEWEEEWEKGYRKRQIRCINGDANMVLPATEDGSFDMAHIHATMKTLEESLDANKAAGEDMLDKATAEAAAAAAEFAGGFARAEAAAAAARYSEKELASMSPEDLREALRNGGKKGVLGNGGVFDGYTEERLEALASGYGAPRIAAGDHLRDALRKEEGNKDALPGHVGAVSMAPPKRGRRPSNLVMGGHSRKSNAFTTITEERSMRSLGFVMIRDDMVLSDVREKITSQFGSVVPKFQFIKDRAPILYEEEERLEAYQGFTPQCVVRIAKREKERKLTGLP